MGVRAIDIVRFNWPPYAAAATASIVALSVAIGAPTWIVDGGLRVIIGTLGALAAAWVAGSCVVAWWVFEHSGATRWEWLPEAIGGRPSRWVNITTGFDDTTATLQVLLPGTIGIAVDLFDADARHDRSSLRARAARPPVVGSLAVPSMPLPIARGSADAVLFLMAAHELRAPGALAGALAEARRILVPAGRVVVVEHLRDIANALAFGPGVFHFYPRRRWLEVARAADLSLAVELHLTPFVSAFVFEAAEPG